MLQDSLLKHEHHYLLEESKDFVDEYPQISNFLAEQSSDPDINRTIDGFLYLTTQLNTKLKLEYPQLTSSLMDMLWPNYLQSTPSITIIEFTTSHLHSEQVKAGSLVKSVTTDYAPTECQFKISRDTWVSPFSITQTKKLTSHLLEITFSAQAPITLTKTELDRLNLFCGHDYTGFQLYLWLSNYLTSVSLVINGSEYSLSDVLFEPVGFKNDEAILDFPRNTFSGYRLLHEYFCYPEGFLFFNMSGFPDYFDRLTVDQFSLKLTFSQPFPEMAKIWPNTIKTNCVPAINLFYFDCEPIYLTGKKNQYPLVTDYLYREGYETVLYSQCNGLAARAT